MSAHPATTSSPLVLALDLERQRCRDKGLCFRCGDPFKLGHCYKSSFSLMEITDEGEEVIAPLDNENGTEMEEEDAEISFNAILGNAITTAMKLQGSLKGRSVIILVDSGSTHNFVSKALVCELQLPVQQIPTFGVQIGNGSMVRCNRVCTKVEVKISDLTIIQDFYLLSLGGADLVLGIKWLASLNTVQANWNKMFMIFWLNGRKYKLQGVVSDVNEPAHL